MANCNLLDIGIPDSVLEEYLVVQNERNSAGAAESMISSTRMTSAGGTKPLNKFKYVDIPPLSRPAFLSFAFDEASLEAVLLSKFPSLVDVLSDLTGKLSQLRSIIHSITWVGGSTENTFWNELRIQSLMMLFLNYTFAACADHMEATAANVDKITLSLDAPDGSTVTWRGSADLKCCNSHLTSIDEASATLEMKLPFNQKGLYKTAAMQPKQQLLGCAMGLRQQYNQQLIDQAVMCITEET